MELVWKGAVLLLQGSTWVLVSVHQNIYKKNDTDDTGTMSTPEMRLAFRDAGKSLSAGDPEVM